MADLILEAYDRFVALYDILALVDEKAAGESELVHALQLSPAIVSQMVAFLIMQGFVKTTGSDSEFGVTALGRNFLQEFEGMRRFLS